MSDVYFATMRTTTDDSIPKKLTRLIKAAGIDEAGLDGKYVGIKAHFGEMENMTFLKPAYTRTIAQHVSELGGKPFVFDCCTLYPGMRSNGLDYLQCAAMNGFNATSCAAPVVIGDGIRGNDEVALPTPPGSTLESALIGRVVNDADFLITLTHAKGCISTSYAGVLKNLAMGCASRAGKMAQHSEGTLNVIPPLCIGCGKCVSHCAQGALSVVDGKAVCDADLCVGCGYCMPYCPRAALMGAMDEKYDLLQKKVAEYAGAVTQAVECLHVAIAIDITPHCDCFPGNDAPMVPNVGMFASKDPVALDQAIADMVNSQPVLANGPLPERYEEAKGEGVPAETHFHAVNPHADWTIALEHAEMLGMGTRAYELHEVK